MFDTGIITCPREGGTYLGQSVDSYLRSWDVIPHVFAEPGTQKCVRGHKVIWHHNVEQLGIVENWLQMADTMLSISNQPYLLLCEDDVYWTELSGLKCRNAMLDDDFSDCGFFSPYCSKINAYEAKINSYVWSEPRKLKWTWCGCLTLFFPRKSLELLLAHKDEFWELTLGLFPEERLHVYLDYAIGEFFRKRGFRIMTHMPTLVFHLGEVSTWGGNNTLKAKTNDSRLPAIPKNFGPYRIKADESLPVQPETTPTSGDGRMPNQSVNVSEG